MSRGMWDAWPSFFPELWGRQAHAAATCDLITVSSYQCKAHKDRAAWPGLPTSLSLEDAWQEF